MPQAKWNGVVIADATDDDIVTVEGNDYVSHFLNPSLYKFFNGQICLYKPIVSAIIYKDGIFERNQRNL